MDEEGDSWSNSVAFEADVERYQPRWRRVMPCDSDHYSCGCNPGFVFSKLADEEMQEQADHAEDGRILEGDEKILNGRCAPAGCVKPPKRLHGMADPRLRCRNYRHNGVCVLPGERGEGACGFLCHAGRWYTQCRRVPIYNNERMLLEMDQEGNIGQESGRMRGDYFYSDEDVEPYTEEEGEKYFGPDSTATAQELKDFSKTIEDRRERQLDLRVKAAKDYRETQNEGHIARTEKERERLAEQGSDRPGKHQDGDYPGKHSRGQSAAEQDEIDEKDIEWPDVQGPSVSTRPRR